jgi:hypothetical protein
MRAKHSTPAKRCMPEPLRIVVSGATGRMGSTLARLAGADPALTIVGGIDRDGAAAVAPGFPRTTPSPMPAT